tara:strand:- start:318 stop:479 length:162 start_codon:yes stop_codon:yes gene_type:complete
MKEEKRIKDLLFNYLSHILRRSIEINAGEQLVNSQDYRERINCISDSDFSKNT